MRYHLNLRVGHLFEGVALVRAGAHFDKGVMIEREHQDQEDAA